MRSIAWSVVSALTLAATSRAGAPAAAACDHPYFPMVKGQTYVYRASGIDVTEVITRIEGEQVTLDVTTGAGARSRTTTVTETCTAEGIGSQAAHSADGKTSVRTTKRSGAEYGPAAQMRVGGAWSFQDVTESVHGGTTVTSDRRSTSKVVSSEQVTVPAGTYDTLRVESVVDVTMPTAGRGADRASRNTPRHYRTVAWIAKGVGLVKMESLSESGEASAASELVSFKK